MCCRTYKIDNNNNNNFGAGGAAGRGRQTLATLVDGQRARNGAAGTGAATNAGGLSLTEGRLPEDAAEAALRAQAEAAAAAAAARKAADAAEEAGDGDAERRAEEAPEL